MFNRHPQHRGSHYPSRNIDIMFELIIITDFAKTNDALLLITQAVQCSAAAVLPDIGGSPNRCKVIRSDYTSSLTFTSFTTTNDRGRLLSLS